MVLIKKETSVNIIVITCQKRNVEKEEAENWETKKQYEEKIQNEWVNQDRYTPHL